ncbi:MAG: alpha/beta hydrolase [Gemmatimonadaceae bacterium]
MTNAQAAERSAGDLALPRLRAAGALLEYREIAGRRSQAPPLVFLHSALGSARLWEDLPDKLASATGSRALMYSRQGHGASDPLPSEHDPEYLTHEALDVLPAVLRARSIERPVLVGHSDGATIALINAALSVLRVRGLVLIAPHVIVEDISVAGIEKSARAFEDDDLRTKLAVHHHDVDGMFDRWADVWRRAEFRQWSIVHLLGEIVCPVLVIQGEDDRYGTLAQVELIEDHVAGPVRSMILPDCGHAPQVEYPERVLEEVARFVRTL